MNFNSPPLDYKMVEGNLMNVLREIGRVVSCRLAIDVTALFDITASTFQVV